MHTALLIPAFRFRPQPGYLQLPRHSSAVQLQAHGELGRGEALTLRLPQAAQLQVCRHALWMTRTGAGSAPEADRILHAGEVITLDAGSEWVLEPVLLEEPGGAEGPAHMGGSPARFVIRPLP